MRALPSPTGQAHLAAMWRISRESLRVFGNVSLARLLVHLTVLNLSKRGTPGTAAAVAQATGLSPALVSKIVGELVRQGLVQSKVDTRDRRVRWLFLTSKGRSQKRDYERRTSEVLRRVSTLARLRAVEKGPSLDEIVERLARK